MNSTAIRKNRLVTNKDLSQGDKEQSLDIGELHRKILKYCDDHSSRGEPFDRWFFELVLGNPPLKASLDQRLDKNQFPGGTLLHVIVRGSKDPQQVLNRFGKRFELLKWLLTNFPELYDAEDEDNETVLEVFINHDSFSRPATRSRSGINPFVDYFVKEFPESTARQLSRSESEGAIFRLLPLICGIHVKGIGSLYSLIPHLPEAQLREKDGEGNTVLHLVARYKYACDEERKSQESLNRTIEDIIQRYPDMICKQNKGEESPYLHRVNTAKDYFFKNKHEEWHPDVITHLLKDHCVHRPLDEAMKLLYGPRICPGKLIPFAITTNKYLSLVMRYKSTTSR